MRMGIGQISKSAARRRGGRNARHEHVAWYIDLRRNWMLYLMALPAVVSILVFGYGPLFGLSIAFLDYSPSRGVLRSEWVGFEHFQAAFQSGFFLAALRNSIVINVFKLAIGFPAAIALALLLNEVHLRLFKQAVQTATMLPYFISWVVAGTMFRELLAPSGPINEVLQYVFGQQPVNFLSNPQNFRIIIILQDVWKNVGYFAVLYLAAIANIDPTLYEASMVDGANRWQQTWHVTLPGIRATMITLFVLLTGYLISAGFEQIYVMYNVSVYSTADVIETFTYRLGISQSRYSFATAVGLFQSVVGFALVLFTNTLVKRFNQEGLF